MTEMEPLFADMIHTLREARAAVQREMQPQVAGQAADRPSLLRIQMAARSFEAQAAPLSQVICKRRPDQVVMDEAEDLGDFFRCTVVEFDARLAASQE